MGIYPEEKYEKQRNGNLIYTQETPGLLITTVYIPVVTIEARNNCYCCSCFDDYHDPYCRNHGYTNVIRACEIHQMPGEGGDLALKSVQDFREGFKAAHFHRHYGRY